MSFIRAKEIPPHSGNWYDYEPYNLPWNLIVLCHDCHLAIHEAMRPPVLKRGAPDNLEDAKKIGQYIMYGIV